jgi:hypothetical protein
MRRRFPRHWAARLGQRCFSCFPHTLVPACAQQPEPPTADITFAIRDANHTDTWPVSVREVAIDGKPIHLDHSVHVQGSWLSTVTITLRNVSPKTIVRGGIGIVFLEAGDGSGRS